MPMVKRSKMLIAMKNKLRSPGIVSPARGNIPSLLSVISQEARADLPVSLWSPLIY
jgi:hypothetical protein